MSIATHAFRILSVTLVLTPGFSSPGQAQELVSGIENPIYASKLNDVAVGVPLSSLSIKRGGMESHVSAVELHRAPTRSIPLQVSLSKLSTLEQANCVDSQLLSIEQVAHSTSAGKFLRDLKVNKIQIHLIDNTRSPVASESLKRTFKVEGSTLRAEAVLAPYGCMKVTVEEMKAQIEKWDAAAAKQRAMNQLAGFIQGSTQDIFKSMESKPSTADKSVSSAPSKSLAVPAAGAWAEERGGAAIGQGR